jgi:hypothetical protein
MHGGPHRAGLHGRLRAAVLFPMNRNGGAQALGIDAICPAA